MVNIGTPRLHMGSACRTGTPSPRAGEMTRGESTPMSTGGPANPTVYQPNVKYVLLLGLMCALPAVTSDIYLPSLPDVARDLDTTTTAVQLTMTGVLVEAALRPALRGYATLLRDRQFVAVAVLPGLGTAVLISYVVGSPFVLREGFGLSANQFALLFAVNGVALVGGAQVNASLVRRVAPIRILRVAVPLLLAVAVTLLVVAVTGAGGLFGLLAVLWLLLGLFQFIPPNASAIALGRHLSLIHI